MDTNAGYREIVQQIILEYAGHKPRHGQIETEALMDTERDHYKVMHIGFEGLRRVYGSVIHLDIIDGKIWIQYDGTNRSVAEALLAAGVPREDIVLGFHPAKLRPQTDFAIA